MQFHRKEVSSILILCQVYKCWSRKRSTVIREKLRQESEFKCQHCAVQKAGIVEKCPDTK